MLREWLILSIRILDDSLVLALDRLTNFHRIKPTATHRDPKLVLNHTTDSVYRPAISVESVRLRPFLKESRKLGPVFFGNIGEGSSLRGFAVRPTPSVHRFKGNRERSNNAGNCQCWQITTSWIGFSVVRRSLSLIPVSPINRALQSIKLKSIQIAIEIPMSLTRQAINGR